MKRAFAIVDCRIPSEMERRLNILGFSVLSLPPFNRLSEAVASHTDMLVARLGREYISTADYCEAAPHVFTDLSLLIGGTGASVTLTSDDIYPDYPRDCRLNILVMGNYLFARTESVSPYIIERATEYGLKVISVRQGYPACTVLRLDAQHAITADAGMTRAMRGAGIKVTEIENGDISLPPHEYGFIGGCAGVYGDKIYFLGDPKTHRSYDKIQSACEDAGLTPISLGGGPLLDLGGILFAEGDFK